MSSEEPVDGPRPTPDLPNLTGEISLQEAVGTFPREHRISPRQPVELDAGLRRSGAAGVGVQVMDLSAHGFRIDTHLDLVKGTDVWLRLPGLEARHAKVVWARGHEVGCAFEQPLHPAVLAMIVGGRAGG